MAPSKPTIPVRPEGDRPAPGYEVIEHLRRGRDIDVYDAWSYERDCRCVVKVLRPDRRAHAPARKRLRHEARLLLELAHPHIVRAYELVVRPDPLLALETLDGETLEHMIARRSQRLPVSDLAFLGMHLCSAMHYVHAHGHLHLDLKPSNVISDYGQAKVIDLSIARRPGRGRRGVGTRQYLSPEQARGGMLTPAADVWGIGVVLFEAATARRAFEDGVAALLQTNHAGRRLRLRQVASWPSLRGLRRLPHGFAAAVEACLEPYPRDRPTVRELSAALDPFA